MDRFYTDIEKLRICAAIQSGSLGVPSDARFSIVPAELVEVLRKQDQHSQDIKAGDRVCFVNAEHWSGLVARGLQGFYAVKDVRMNKRRIAELHLRRQLNQVTDALRRVFSLKGTKWAA